MMTGVLVPKMFIVSDKWATVLLISLVLFSGILHAQEGWATRVTLAPADAMVSSGIAISAPLPPPRRTADRPFWTMVALTVGSSVFDGETTMQGLETGRYHEVNPLLGAHPNRLRFYATAGATDAAMGLLAWHLKHNGHEKLWKVPLLGTTAAHLAGAINNVVVER